MTKSCTAVYSARRSYLTPLAATRRQQSTREAVDRASRACALSYARLTGHVAAAASDSAPRSACGGGPPRRFAAAMKGSPTRVRRLRAVRAGCNRGPASRMALAGGAGGMTHGGRAITSLERHGRACLCCAPRVAGRSVAPHGALGGLGPRAVDSRPPRHSTIPCCSNGGGCLDGACFCIDLFETAPNLDPPCTAAPLCLNNVRNLFEMARIKHTVYRSKQ